jgi:hypothetical protein
VNIIIAVTTQHNTIMSQTVNNTPSHKLPTRPNYRPDGVGCDTRGNERIGRQDSIKLG